MQIVSHLPVSGCALAYVWVKVMSTSFNEKKKYQLKNLRLNHNHRMQSIWNELVVLCNHIVR